MKFVFFHFLVLVSKIFGSSQENENVTKIEKPEILEQLDPSIYMRQSGMYPQNFQSQQFLMQGAPNIGFTCKCTQKSLNNPILTNPLGSTLDANQVAQQQILQLQDQVRRQQEIINRQALAKSGIENFANLIALANSLDCTCSSDTNTNTNTMSPMSGFPQNMGSIYQGAASGFPAGGFVQRGVPIVHFAQTQPMVEMPFKK